ncbi:YceD family protein [Falsiroseomonas sp. HW251]|uniref:YceD family protein n=1 Tax=Falsiroseomonas sp. HW251 TaxID=3390998 RepID=UPI003D32120B
MKPEFSRLVRLSAEPREVTLEATPAECAALARRFGILGVASVSAGLRIVPEPGGSWRARGRLLARVEQACVVTLEPVSQAVDAPLDLRILEEGAEPADDDPDSPDEIESQGGQVELGEAVAEQLSLALDPYPRAEGAELPPMDPAEEPETPAAQPNPFAALAKLRQG